jgi:hypothetical protein
MLSVLKSVIRVIDCTNNGELGQIDDSSVEHSSTINI